MSNSKKAFCYNQIAWKSFLLGVNWEFALKYIDLAIQEKPTPARVDTKYWILLRMNKKKEVLEAMDECLKLCSNDLERGKFLSYHARIYLELNQPDDALKCLQEAEKRNPKIHLLQIAWAEYEIHRKNYAKAEDHIKKGFQLTKNISACADLKKLQAKIYAEQGKYQDAVTLMREVKQTLNTGTLEIQPFFFAYAEYLLKAGYPEEAETELKKIQSVCSDRKKYDALFKEITAVMVKKSPCSGADKM